MTDYKISQLTALAVPAYNDLLVAVDVSDTSTPPAGTGGSDKKATLAQLVPVTVWPSGDATGATDAAAINTAIGALPTVGGVHIGTVILAATAPWYIECGIVTHNGSGVTINASGCYIYAVGSGDMIRMYDSSTYDSRDFQSGGLIGFPVIDGTNTTGDATAFHAGDILQLAVFAQVQNFTAGTTSKGIWLDCQYYWTEQCYGRIYAQTCTTGVMFDNSTGTSMGANATGSFERFTFDIYIDSVGVGDGVTFNNGANTLGGRISIMGNFLTSTTQYAVLKFIGNNASGYSGMAQGQLNVGVEIDDTTHTPPYTIYMGSGSNYITGAVGFMQFDGTFTSCNSGAVLYAGPVLGDNNIVSYASLGTNALALSVTGNGQTIYTVFYPLVQAAPGSSSYTGLILQAGEFGGQMVTVVNTGTGSLTFASAGTSNVANGTGAVIAALTAVTFIWDATDSLWYAPPAGSGGGSGTVTAVSVATANGFAGTVANATTTPAITMETTVTGLLKGNGTAVSAASAGTDYVVPGGTVATATSAGTAFYAYTGGTAFYATSAGTAFHAGTAFAANSAGTAFYATSAGTAFLATSATSAGTAFYSLTSGTAYAATISSGTASYALTSGTAYTTGALQSATTNVIVSTATAPSSNQVLTATSGTSATWQTFAAGGTAFYATTAGTAFSATSAISAGTAFYALTAGTASYALTGGTAYWAGTASYSLTSGTAFVGTSALTAGTAFYATSAGTAYHGGTAFYANTSGTAFSATTSLNFSSGATLPDYLAPAVVALSFGGSIVVNAASGNAYNVTLTSNIGTITTPTNPVDGQVIRFRITQGTGGTFTTVWGAGYDFGAVGTTPTLSTTAAKVDIVAFEYVASITKWACLGSGMGY